MKIGSIGLGLLLLAATYASAETVTFSGGTFAEGAIDGVSQVGKDYTLTIDLSGTQTFLNDRVTIAGADIVITVNIDGVDYVVDEDGGNYFFGVNGAGAFGVFGFADAGIGHIYGPLDGNEALNTTPALDGETITQYLNRTGLNGSSFTEEAQGLAINDVLPGTLNNGANNISQVLATSGGDLVTINAVPEPASLALCGLAAVGLVRRRRKQTA